MKRPPAPGGTEPPVRRRKSLEPRETSAPPQIRNRADEIRQVKDCPLLSTVNRYMLDFDFEAVCSLTGCRDNVYCCLACGAYLQGRGSKTPVFDHALALQHHLYIRLDTAQVYCVPDNYEVVDSSLDDIKFNLSPHFTRAEVEAGWQRCTNLSGGWFIPGMMGINAVNRCTDYATVVVRLLVCIEPLRDFFLLRDKPTSSPLVNAMGRLVRRLFNPRSFKGMVSPHEFLQACHVASNKQFSLTTKADAHLFLVWLLHYLRRRKALKSIVEEAVCGRVEGDREFTVLSLDLPPTPVFVDKATAESNIEDLLHAVTQPPPYLITHLKRFQRNNYYTEVNSNQVQLPLTNLQLAGVTYELLCNVVHCGAKANIGKFVTYSRHSDGSWYLLEDLRIQPVEPHRVTSSDASYVQLWRLKK